MESVRKFERVVVADDLTESSEAAIERAASLPLADRAELHLLHVMDAELPGELSERTEANARGALRARASTATRVARGRSPSSDVSVETHVLRGVAFVEIIRHARRLGADLIVVGRHHPRRLRDAFIGSTAERVVRKSDLPVLLAASPAAGAYRNVVAAVDLSDTSRRVVELAASLIPADCGVTLVHAYDVAFESTFARSVGASPMEEMRRARHDEAVAAGDQLRKALEPLHIDFRLRVRKGDPRVALLREVLREKADLLVVGTHARSGIAHALLGSVAEWVIRAAPCDVAVTRPVRFTFELP